MILLSGVCRVHKAGAKKKKKNLGEGGRGSWRKQILVQMYLFIRDRCLVIIFINEVGFSSQ